jgi:hypothetical protein
MFILTIKPKPEVKPPEYAVLEGCEKLGGATTAISPRRLTTTDNVTFCEGRVAGVFVNCILLNTAL